MPPWLVLAIAASLLAAIGYQILRATSLKRVPVYWIVIAAGFLGAEAIADSTKLVIIRLGELAIIPDLVGMLVAICILRLVRL
jgi:hypothetical protein